jgi:uncharacterized protein YjiS (DUF1127 family)
MKMTALQIGSPARHRAAPFNLHASLERVRDAYERRQQYLKTVRELSAMSDRDLADIGIRRGDFHSVAKGTFIRGQS